MLTTPRLLSAQSGSLAGVVTDSTGAPMPGAQISVVGTRFAIAAGTDGRYRIVGVPAGTYNVRAQRIGSPVRMFSGVAIRAGEETRLDVQLAVSALQIAGYVVSASRRVEKITDAPATVTRIDADQIRSTVGNSFTAALKDIKGVDFFQTGIAAAGINARGFNSAFNNRMLQLEDNRIAVLPENGLPVGVFTTIPKVDIAGVEVLIGPGAALYGPDASNGVITLLSKDPKQFPGTILEMSVGGNSLSGFGDETPGTVSFTNLQGRHAGVLLDGRLGYKITGEIIDAYDWQNVNTYGPAAAPSPEIGIDWNTDYLRGGGALVWYFDNGSRLEYQGGASKSNGVGITSVGRNQLKDWGYWNQQVRFTSDRFFAQAYATRSLSGETFALNGYSTNRLSPRFAGQSDDSVRKASSFPADGRLMAAEAQHNFTLPSLLNTRIVYGAQLRRDVVSSRRVWLEDALTGEDITLQQVGVYAQTETPVNEYVKVVLGARYDQPEFYDDQFSPKAALLVSPTENNTFRLTYNRAFKSPTILQTSFYYRDFQPFVGVFGNRDGMEIRNAAGDVLRTLDAVQPELNNTFEVGYKGIIKDKLFLEVAGWRSNYEAFLSPLVVVANPLAGAAATFAHNARTGTKYTNAAGGEQIALTYYNLGKATLSGIDAGWRYLITPTVTTSGTMSFMKLDSIAREAGDPIEATALNSPTSKFTVGMESSALPLSTFGGFTLRFVKDYKFLSGVHNGHIPGLLGLDFNLGYRLPSQRAQINLSVQNAFVCTSGTTTPPAFLAGTSPATYTSGWECGFGREHIELLNMPAIGSMAFLGIRFDL